MRTRLIVRADLDRLEHFEFTLSFPVGRAQAALLCAGEDVFLGQSEVPGIWQIQARARIDSWTPKGDQLICRFVNIRHLRESIMAVTAGDPESDYRFEPYLIDTILPGDALSGVIDEYDFRQADQTLVGTMAEDQKGFFLGECGRRTPRESQEQIFFHRVATAYSWRCALSHISYSPIASATEAYAVVGVEEPFARDDGLECDGLFLSKSFASAYSAGLLAIGDEYEVLRHAGLGAEMRMLLEVANPRAMVHLPADPAFWPISMLHGDIGMHSGTDLSTGAAKIAS